VTVLTPVPAPVKPRMRGWIHLWSAVVSGVACAVLVSVGAALRGGAAAAATAVYTATVIGLFVVSATYHRRTWRSPRSERVIRRADHSMIYLFIAGTYTPVAVFALPGGAARGLLLVVWIAALVGVGLQLLGPRAPAWLGVPIYVALGWVAVFVLPDLLATGGVAALVLLLVGGGLYTLGAVVYAVRRPDPWPSTFGFHEIFHAATALAAICHHVAIWLLLFR